MAHRIMEAIPTDDIVAPYTHYVLVAWRVETPDERIRGVVRRGYVDDDDVLHFEPGRTFKLRIEMTHFTALVNAATEKKIGKLLPEAMLTYAVTNNLLAERNL